MNIPQSHFAPWFRKHDPPGTPLVPDAPVIFYPQSLEQLIYICSHRGAKRLHAAGSHWALSTAAVSDHSFIETHDWNEIFPAMGRTLYDVVPACLSKKFLQELNVETQRLGAGKAPRYFVHFETGKRIYQLYSELDVGDAGNAQSLCELMKSQFHNSAFEGSWAFQTLGGAGGQTVVGALSTGTHGGDFDRPPVADSVIALHVVADGGKHYWIERPRDGAPFTDEKKLRAIYGAAQYGGPDNFTVLYNENVWRAAMVQVGRFGVVYSAVVEVVRQYGLRQEVTLDTWEKVRDKISNPNSDLYIKPYSSPSGDSIPQRFLQIAINPIPSVDGTVHECGITRRWTVSMDEVPASPLPAVNWGGLGNPAGRAERVGDRLRAFDNLIAAALFANAGASVPYSPDESGVTSFSFFETACQDPNFLDGVVTAIFDEIENFIANNAVAIGGALAGAIAAGLGPSILALIPALLAILALLALFLEALGATGGQSLGGAMNDVRSALLGSSDPAQRLAGILVWRAIAAKAFESQQSPQTFSAISYAVMDGHDYTDKSCAVNVRSVEVFFDAEHHVDRLISFVDRLLLFEINQEFDSGLSVVGYVSLRFTGASEATIAPQPFARTCCIECSGLADANGSAQFVDYAVKLALDPNIKGLLHWGQQNTSTQQQVEFRFGDTPSAPTGPLHDWRGVLSRLTDNGRLDGFSSAFTMKTGLEIVQPETGAFSVTHAPSAGHPSCTVSWDCTNNPPQTEVSLNIQSPSSGTNSIGGLPLSGTHTFNAAQPGNWVVTLIASLDRNGDIRTASQAVHVTGV